MGVRVRPAKRNQPHRLIGQLIDPCMPEQELASHVLCGPVRIHPNLLGGNTVRYAEFRDRLEGALQEAGLLVHDADRRVETIELADTVRRGRIVAVLGGNRDLEVQALCRSDGFFPLRGVAISGFRTVRVPHVWDANRDPHGDLRRLVRTFKATLDEWTKSVSELATWIRYSPPPLGASRSNPGSKISPRTTMTVGRRRYTD